MASKTWTMMELAGHSDNDVVDAAIEAITRCQEAGMQSLTTIGLEEALSSLRNEALAESDRGPPLLRLNAMIYPSLFLYRKMTYPPTPTSFERLGAGTFATVFAWSSISLKQVANPQDINRLLREYNDLETISKATAFSNTNNIVVFRLPRPWGFFRSYWDFAKKMHLHRFIERCLAPHALYAMQMVHPVPRGLAADIVGRFFPEQHRGAEPPSFLARLYIGARPRRSRAVGMPEKNMFSPLNFQLSASMMEELSLPVAELAKAMGRTLASINFLAGADGRDIEFVLGGDPDDPLRKPGYACIDLNQLRQHKGDPSVIVDAWLQNDPYYPRPASAYWAHFESGYLEIAATVGQHTLASLVIEGILGHLQLLKNRM